MSGKLVRPQIIATDLDGTSLYDGIHMTPRLFDMFCRAQAKGVQVVIVTGRSSMYLREMEMPDYRYAVCNNGVIVMDMLENKPVYKDLFTPEEAILAWEIIKPYNAYMELAVENRLVIDEHSLSIYPGFDPPLLPHMRKYIAEGKMTVVEDMDAFIRAHADEVEKFTIPRNGYEITEGIRRDLDATGLFRTRAAEDIDVMIIPKRTHKGVALLGLADYLGIPHEAVYAFGDGGNDLQMLKSAGCGVAMGNAPDFVKEQADYVCGTCAEDGLAEFIESNFDI